MFEFDVEEPRTRTRRHSQPPTLGWWGLASAVCVGILMAGFISAFVAGLLGAFMRGSQ